MSAIREAWCRETSSTPGEWTEDNPALGQCAVTALVVQDLLGGKLLRCEVDGESHYFNVLEDGEGIDLTFEQFLGSAAPGDEGPSLITASEERDREYVLSHPSTRVRYEMLRTLVARKLARRP